MTPPDFAEQLRAALNDLSSGGRRLSRAAAARRIGLSRPNFHRLARLARGPSWANAWRVLVGLRLDLSRFFPPGQVLESAWRLLERERANGVVHPGDQQKNGAGESALRPRHHNDRCPGES